MTCGTLVQSAALEAYLSAPLSVLALWEPWAILCVARDSEHDCQPPKVHETRHWRPHTARPFAVAIHATKTFNGDVRVAFEDARFKAALKRCGIYPGDPRPLLSGKMRASLRPAPLGAIVGIATVASVDPMGHSANFGEPGYPAHADDQRFGLWQDGRYAWRLADAIELPRPIPHSGRQDALYSLDLEAREEINLQLRELFAGRSVA